MLWAGCLLKAGTASAITFLLLGTSVAQAQEVTDSGAKSSKNLSVKQMSEVNLPEKKLSEKSYYLVSQKVIDAYEAHRKRHSFRKGPPLDVVAKEDKNVLIKLTIDEVEQMAEAVHEEFHSCGGFIEVDQPIEDAGGVENFVKKGLSEKQNFVMAPFDIAQVRFADESKSIIEKVRFGRFEQLLSTLTDFPDRSARSENGRRAAHWLRDMAKNYAASAGRSDVTVEMVPTGSRYTQDSVVVKIKGKTDKPGVLVGGHMDTFQRNKPGADDDGTGTISALEIFQSVIDSGRRFDRDMYFVFYAAEELGLVGSSRVAEKFKNEGIGLRAVLQFDMTGYRSPGEQNEMYFIDDNVNIAATELAEKIAQRVLGIPKNKIARTSCGYACSDHASWHRRGYAAVFPFESSFRRANRDIHTSRDTVEKLDMERALQFVKFGLAFMVELAEPVSLAEDQGQEPLAESEPDALVL